MNLLIASRAAAPLHGRGGLERAVADLCNGLTARGHAVTLITTAPTTPPGDGQPLDVRALVTVPWQSLPGLRRGSALDRAVAYPRLVRAVTARIAATANRYDAAIGMGALAAALVPLRQSGQVRRLIHNPQGMEEFFGHPAKRLVLRPQQRLVRHAARHADAVIATDDVLVATVIRTLRVPRDRVAVVPNGINLAYLDSLRGETQPTPSEPHTLTFVSVGRIVPNKGLDLLAAALGRIRDDLPLDWRWLHVGDGPARGALDAAISRASIAPHARLLGAVSDDDLHRTLAAATLFVHPTRYEGSSLVTLEAMGHGLPVIAAAAGGIPDKVIAGVTGWLVPPGDAARLAAAILHAAKLPRATLTTMGTAGRTRVVERFSLARTLDLTESLLMG